MTITLSPHLVDPTCVARALVHAASWQPVVGHLPGRFEIQHGDDSPCRAVHGAPFNGEFWIAALPRGCRVFRSRKGASLDYAGAGNHAAYQGGCSCGHGH